MAHAFDLVVRGGEVADGSGCPERRADVAIKDGKIAAVGSILQNGREEIDARGMLVTPGFVDIHTHYDGQATWDFHLQPSSCHGVTTAVMGNCGVGFAPVRTQDRDRLIELMEGVEDIPGAALHEGLSWNWESFGSYLDALESRHHDIDIGTQLPHGALRLYVMGERGARLEPATESDVVQMRHFAADAMRAGALGFSTSRTINHRTAKGASTPSLYAGEAELTAIALGLADAGSGVIEVVSDFDTPNLDAEFAMLRRLVESSGRPLSLSLSQAHGSPENWRLILKRIEDAAGDGLPIRAQVAPRPVGVLLGLQATIHPFVAHDTFAAIKDKPLSEMVATMRDRGFRARILAEDVTQHSHPLSRQIRTFEQIFPLGNPPNYEPSPESSIAAIAARLGRQAADVAYDLLLEDNGQSFLYGPFANFAYGTLDHCGEMIAHADCVIGLGDGGAHVGLICDASFPTYLLTHWGRDRATGRFDIGWLIKRQTFDTARAVGLLDRGLIAPGMKADLNVIDFGKLGLSTPYMAYDLPAGGKRLLQGATGYTATIVSGVVTYRDGQASGALPGRLIRGPQPRP